MTDAHSAFPDLKRLVILLGKVLLWPLSIIAIAAIALEVVGWQQEEIHHGPFVTEDIPGARLAAFIVASDRPFQCCLEARSDANGNPTRSDLRLWINDREMGPPHAQHDDIRRGGTGAFSHWGQHVLFSLPLDIENTSAMRATVRYGLRPLAGTAFLLALMSGALGILIYRRTLKAMLERWGEVVALVILRAPYLLLRILGYLGLAASIFYVACTAYALLSGWALPTTAVIRWFPIAEWAAGNERELGYVLLTCAGLGVVAAWAAPFVRGGTRLVCRQEIVLLRFFRRWGFLIAACVLVFSISAIWAGTLRQRDFHSASIGGLIAFSDAGDYMAAAYDQARDGVWSGPALRRPLAAAFRSVLLFIGNYSYADMLLGQALLVAAAICFAAWAVARWRGLWAGLAFFALNYIYVRTFVPTSLTEPLGLCWALFAVPFLIEALRTGSQIHALIGFGATTVALMTRMGSMFTIPALMLWLIWQFGDGAKAKVRMAAYAVTVLVTVISISYLLQQAYGSGAGSTGSNIAYTICGLTIGERWDGCLKRYVQEGGQIPRGDMAQSQLMYSMAWDYFQRTPTVFFERLFLGAREFLGMFPHLLWRGYFLIPEPSWFPRTSLSLLAVGGLAYVIINHRKSRDVTFWVLLWASVIASAAVVFFDDGPRVLAASYPLMSLFFVVGLAGPKTVSRSSSPDQRLVRVGVTTFASAVFLFFCIPWFAHRLFPAKEFVVAASAESSNQHVVFGGSRMSGFLIVDDGKPLRHDIPTLHLSSFAGIIRQSGLESWQGLLHPTSPPIPFGFVNAPRLPRRVGSGRQYIVPPEVLEARDVQAWRFTIKAWHPKPNVLQYGPYWFYVTNAEKLR